MGKKSIARLVCKKKNSLGARNKEPLNNGAVISEKELQKRSCESMGSMYGSQGLEFQYPTGMRAEAIANKRPA